jgi:hypothetical protein
MSRKDRNSFKNFLVRDGYLIIFSLICGVVLFSYFWANKSFESEDDYKVLGSSSIRGIWFKADSAKDCPGADLVNADACVDSTYFDDFESFPTNSIDFDDRGRVLYSNDHLFISGIFDMQEYVDDEIWNNLEIGSLTLKINDRQWVFEDVVLNKEDINSLLEIVKTDSGYLIVLHPSVTLTGRGRHVWVFEYLSEEDSVKQLYFEESGKKAFVEGTYTEIIKEEEGLILKIDWIDPALMGSREVNLYELTDVLLHKYTFVVLPE